MLLQRGITFWKLTRSITLLELLVVVGIISLLVGLSLPSYIEAKKQAQKVSCRVAIKSYAIGLNEQGRLVIEIPQEANCHDCHKPRYNARKFLDTLATP